MPRKPAPRQSRSKKQQTPVPIQPRRPVVPPPGTPPIPHYSDPQETTHLPPTTTEGTPRKNFAQRAQAKNFFLTYPACSTTKEECLHNLLNIAPPGRLTPLSVHVAVIVRENHKDGTPHIHIGLFLADKLRTSDHTFFDYIAGKHGSYEVMISVAGTIKYLTKDDTQPLIHGDLATVSQASRKSKLSESVADMITSGSTLDQVNREHPSFFMLNQRKIKEYQQFCILARQRASFPKVRFPLIYHGADPSLSSIIEWLNINLNASPTGRPFKSPQLYIEGPPNTCKTSLVLLLKKYFRIFFAPMFEDFYDSYDDDAYDLVVFDEFHTQKTLQFMNQFLDGQPMILRKKGEQIYKNKNIPVILLSNFSPETCYPRGHEIFVTRIKHVVITEPLPIDNIVFRVETDEDEPVIVEPPPSINPSLTTRSSPPRSPAALTPPINNEKEEWEEPDTDLYESFINEIIY